MKMQMDKNIKSSNGKWSERGFMAILTNIHVDGSLHNPKVPRSGLHMILLLDL